MPQIAYIVDDPAAPSSAEAILADLMEGAGHTVTLHSPIQPAAEVEDGADVVVVTPGGSTFASALGTKYKASARPVVVFGNVQQQWDLTTFALCTSSQFSQSGNRTWTVLPEAVGEPEAAGFTGDVNVWSSNTASSRHVSAVLAGALPVAVVNDTPDKVCVFSVPPGTLLADGATVVPGYRVGIGAHAQSIASYRTPVFDQWFLALVAEAAAQGGDVVDPPNAAPTANAGANKSVTVGAPTTGTGSGSDADGTIAAYQWRIITKPASSTATLTGATTATWGLTPDVAGEYVLGLVVTDDDGAVSPEKRVTITAFAVVPPEGVPVVSRPVLIDLRDFQPGAGGALTFTLSHVSGPDDGHTEVAEGLFELPDPASVVVKAYQVAEAGGATINGQVTVHPAGATGGPTGTATLAMVEWTFDEASGLWVSQLGEQRTPDGRRVGTFENTLYSTQGAPVMTVVASGTAPEDPELGKFWADTDTTDEN